MPLTHIAIVPKSWRTPSQVSVTNNNLIGMSGLGDGSTNLVDMSLEILDTPDIL